MLRLDGPVMRVLHIVTNSIFITVLMVLFSLPLFTCGAALCAGYSTVRRYLVMGEGENALFVFFRSFKRNFKQATVVWLICAAICMIFWQGIGIMEALDFDGIFAAILPGALILCIALCVMVLFCALANAARFHNTVIQLLKNSILLCISNFWRMVLLILILALSVLLIKIFLPLVLVMPTLIVYCWYRCMEKVFAPFLHDDSQEKTI